MSTFAAVAARANGDRSQVGWADLDRRPDAHIGIGTIIEIGSEGAASASTGTVYFVEDADPREISDTIELERDCEIFDFGGVERRWSRPPRGSRR